MSSNYLALINHHTQGPRCDVTPLFGDYRAFTALLDDFMAHLNAIECDVVVGIDALGFILGTALALRLRKGFVPIRKGG
ncbi:MAG: adenine phosphoribosyltransferase, partial [Ktedonobacterales bacterium]